MRRDDATEIVASSCRIVARTRILLVFAPLQMGFSGFFLSFGDCVPRVPRERRWLRPGDKPRRESVSDANIAIEHCSVIAQSLPQGHGGFVSSEH